MSTSVLKTTPAGHELDIGIYSFGPMPAQNPSSVHLTINHTTNIGGFYFGSDTTLVSLSLPNLTSIDPTSIALGGLTADGCTALTSLSAPLLATLGPLGDVIIVSNALATISFPSLTTCGTFAWGDLTFFTTLNVPNLASVAQLQPAMGNVNGWSLPALTVVTGVEGNQAMVCSGNFGGTTINMPLLGHTTGTIAVTFCANLTTINLNAWIPANGEQIFFTNCPNITSATTNLLLARGVANSAFVSGNLQISGTPTGQGVTDKSTLQGRGVTVVTN